MLSVRASGCHSQSVIHQDATSNKLMHHVASHNPKFVLGTTTAMIVPPEITYSVTNNLTYHGYACTSRYKLIGH